MITNKQIQSILDATGLGGATPAQLDAIADYFEQHKADPTNWDNDHFVYMLDGKGLSFSELLFFVEPENAAAYDIRECYACKKLHPIDAIRICDMSGYATCEDCDNARNAREMASAMQSYYPGCMDKPDTRTKSEIRRNPGGIE